MKRNLTILAALALATAACGSADGVATTAEPTPAAAPTTAAAPATTAAPTTTTAAPTTTVPPTTTTPPTTTAAPTTTTAAPTTTTAPPLPDELLPTHGGAAVAVYLGVVEDSAGSASSNFPDAIAAAEAMGYFVGTGDLTCDQGAAEALGLADGFYSAASVLFATVEDANAFAAAFPGDIFGIAEITTYCLD